MKSKPNPVVKKVKSAQTVNGMLLKLKDPMQIFDLTCANCYFAGRFNGQMPVDESRECFERIKELIIKELK